MLYPNRLRQTISKRNKEIIEGVGKGYVQWGKNTVRGGWYRTGATICSKMFPLKFHWGSGMALKTWRKPVSDSFIIRVNYIQQGRTHWAFRTVQCTNSEFPFSPPRWGLPLIAETTRSCTWVWWEKGRSVCSAKCSSGGQDKWGSARGPRDKGLSGVRMTQGESRRTNITFYTLANLVTVREVFRKAVVPG